MPWGVPHASNARATAPHSSGQPGSHDPLPAAGRQEDVDRGSRDSTARSGEERDRGRGRSSLSLGEAAYGAHAGRQDGGILEPGRCPRVSVKGAGSRSQVVLPGSGLTAAGPAGGGAGQGRVPGISLRVSCWPPPSGWAGGEQPLLHPPSFIKRNCFSDGSPQIIKK